MEFSWNPYYNNRILALEAQGYSQYEIASAISEEAGVEISRDAVRHALERAREKAVSLDQYPLPQRTPYLDKYMPYLLGEKEPEPKNWNRRNEVLAKKKAKGLVHADLHMPLAHWGIINDSFEKHRDADYYIFNADVIDGYDLSRFQKGKSVPFEYEMDECLRYFEFLNEYFYWNEGLGANHEKRIADSIERNLQPSLQFLAQKKILTLLASPFPNIYVHEDVWFFQFGSCVYTHPSRASQIELRAAMDVYNHLQEWQPAYALEPWNVLYVSHTHNMGIAYPSKAKVIETGCLCHTAAYALSPKIPYKHPQSLGFSTNILHEGVADINECREYKYPTEVVL